MSRSGRKYSQLNARKDLAIDALDVIDAIDIVEVCL